LRKSTNRSRNDTPVQKIKPISGLIKSILLLSLRSFVNHDLKCRLPANRRTSLHFVSVA
jgi:hypothetical protein